MIADQEHAPLARHMSQPINLQVEPAGRENATERLSQSPKRCWVVAHAGPGRPRDDSIGRPLRIGARAGIRMSASAMITICLLNVARSSPKCGTRMPTPVVYAGPASGNGRPIIVSQRKCDLTALKNDLRAM